MLKAIFTTSNLRFFINQEIFHVLIVSRKYNPKQCVYYDKIKFLFAMEEDGCPRCKTTKYRNPSLKLLVNICGHTLCDNCVELLFVKG